MIERKSSMPENRGFDSERRVYITRTGEEVSLGPNEYRFALVLDDILNKHLFVNTRDLKRSLDATLRVTVQRTRRDEE